MTLQQQFLSDVIKGLEKSPKSLSSKYFYDAQGDALFQQIMELEGYYLSRAEDQILLQQSAEIIRHLPDGPLEVLELGAGDGRKTQHFLEALIHSGRSFVYRPMDISPDVLQSLAGRLKAQLPDCAVELVAGDYLQFLPERLPGHSRLMLFLGSNLGNYHALAEEAFFAHIGKGMLAGDTLLLGLDLAKSPERILAAYNDPEGITRAFNLNLLHRINRELQGNFKVEAFDHWAVYDPVALEARSYLVSREAAEYSVLNGQFTFSFAPWEAIHVETSRKYALHRLADKGSAYGFVQKQLFLDPQKYFADVLWMRK